MKNFLHKIARIDRRILFLLTIIVILIPIIRPLGLKDVHVTPSVKYVYDYVENLPPGSPVLVSFDFDLGSKPELYPMALAFVRHVFSKDLRIIGMNFWAPGTGLADEILTTAAKEFNKEYGKDYVFLGYQLGYVAIITQMGSDIFGAYPKDQKGNDTRSMPVFEGVKRLKDFSFMMDFTAGVPGIEEWIAYGSDKFGFKIACGATAVNETTLRPYIQTGQMIGLIGAMKGASEYEILTGKPDKATAGMEAVSMGHFLVLFLIVLANVVVLLQKVYR